TVGQYPLCHESGLSTAVAECPLSANRCHCAIGRRDHQWRRFPNSLRLCFCAAKSSIVFVGGLAKFYFVRLTQFPSSSDSFPSSARWRNIFRARSSFACATFLCSITIRLAATAPFHCHAVVP